MLDRREEYCIAELENAALIAGHIAAYSGADRMVDALVIEHTADEVVVDHTAVEADRQKIALKVADEVDHTGAGILRAVVEEVLKEERHIHLAHYPVAGDNSLVDYKVLHRMTSSWCRD